VLPFTKSVQQFAFHTDDATCTVGFGLHVADVYVPELARAAAQHPEVAVPPVTCVKLLRSFIVVLQATRQPVLLWRIRCAPSARGRARDAHCLRVHAERPSSRSGRSARLPACLPIERRDLLASSAEESCKRL
jgi:hypothetical protein